MGCRFRFSRHVAAHIPFTAGVFKGKTFFIYCYFSVASPPPPLHLLPYAALRSSAP
jgi:hypothetical protein